MRFRCVAGGNNKWRNVFQANRTNSGYGVGAHLAKLVYQGKSSQYRVVSHANMACQTRAIGEYGVVAHLAIVGNMGIGHDKIIVTDNRSRSALRRAPAYGAILPDNIPIPNNEAMITPIETQMLWRITDRRKLKDFIVAPNLGVGLDDHVRTNPGIISNGNTLVDAF